MPHLIEPRNLPGGSIPAEEPVGLFHAWWRGDPLPNLPTLPGVELSPALDISPLFAFASPDPLVIRERILRGHQPWVATIAGESIAYGWVTTSDLSIGELGLDVALQPGCRYLWDFFTTPSWRGNGIYPRLLQAIIAHDEDAERFWVGHDLENVASAHGIAKAGFCEVGAVYRLRDGELAMISSGRLDRASAASEQFGITLIDRLSTGMRSS
jgi:GNAT superfamily N-acetyltransferase